MTMIVVCRFLPTAIARRITAMPYFFAGPDSDTDDDGDPTYQDTIDFTGDPDAESTFEQAEADYNSSGW